MAYGPATLQPHRPVASMEMRQKVCPKVRYPRALSSSLKPKSTRPQVRQVGTTRAFPTIEIEEAFLVGADLMNAHGVVSRFIELADLFHVTRGIGPADDRLSDIFFA
jgi:hypothetical protein